MKFTDLEQIYDLMAETLDEVGEDRHALFLAKLSLTLAHKLGDADAVREAITIAREDLD
tara:strand:- start:7236 stop:7412 length:177 start_codon:yes stop_codon:yes gene_type:complete